MRGKLTITIADEVYRGLHQQIGRGEVSRFIEGSVRPHVVGTDELKAECRAAAAETRAEQEALAWIETAVDGALD